MNWNKILSALVAITYIVIVIVHGGAKPAFEFAIFLILPLGCIWFSDAMGGYVELGLMEFGAPITNRSPGILVCIMDWVILLLAIIAGIIIYVSA
jgi:hypothetical protein